MNYVVVNVYCMHTGSVSASVSTIGNTRVSVAYHSFYDNIQLYEQGLCLTFSLAGPQ